jgi:acyl dehydratase
MMREEMLSFARTFDPQPFHVDESKEVESIFGGLTASSLHTLSACTKCVVEAMGDLAILCGVGMDPVNMMNPVRPGDILNVEAAWVDLNASRSRPDRGFARLRCRVTNQNGEEILSYGYKYFVACKPA